MWKGDVMDFILHGNFVYTDKERKLVVKENHYVVCVSGYSKGIFQSVPEAFDSLDIIDYGEKIILPGLIDIHLHAPQYEFRGTGMDCELIEWLNKYTFHAESKYSNLAYANDTYTHIVEDLKNSATTRAVLFGSIHKDATLNLMSQLEQTNLKTYVGKVNMDRNSPEYYIENTEDSIRETIEWLNACDFENTKPILTPRFIPTCTDELLAELQEIQTKYDLHVQSHLSENQGEIEWVRELCPNTRFYGEAYEQYDMLGSRNNSIMAHCVLSGEDEVALMKKNGTFVAHCPSSNMNLSSGIAPVSRYLDQGLNVGFGSDIAGGHSLSIFNEMVLAIQISKMYRKYIDSKSKALTIADVLYMATLGGGKFFGDVGSFEKGYELDAIIMDDTKIRRDVNADISMRLEKMVYLSHECKITAKYVCGKKIF